MSKPRKKKRPPKRVLALPDLEQVQSGGTQYPHVKERSEQL